MSRTQEELFQKLRTIREENSRLAWKERREALRRCLDYELGQLPRDQIRNTLADLMRGMHDGEGSASDRAELQQSLRSTQHECDRLRAERDRMRQQLADAQQAVTETEALRADRDRMEQTLARVGRTSSGGKLSGFRDGIIKTLGGSKPTPAELNLEAEDAALFQSLAEVVSFTLMYDVAVNQLILDLSGKAESGGTTMAVMMRKLFRKRFLASLESEEGADERLKEILQQNLKFMLLMNQGYVSSYRPGTHSLLEEIDPQAILDKHPGMMKMGFDYPSAYRTFQDRFTGLMNHTSNDLWELYFSPRVRKELSEYLDDLPEY